MNRRRVIVIAFPPPRNILCIDADAGAETGKID
jgi:hypothetical protein